MNIFTGSMPAVVTPMQADSTVDWDALADLIEWHIDQGTDALVTVGTTGESATLNHGEHGAVIGFVVDRVRKRIPVIAGTGSNSTDEATELSLDAQKRGADALLQVVPYYNRPSQEGLYQHFQTLANAVALPHLLYNVPTRTGLDMATETTMRLAEIDNIAGIKEAGGDEQRWRTYGELDDFAFVCGEDANNYNMMRLGACGIISVSANVAPKLLSEFCAAANAGDWQLAQQLHQLLSPLHEVVFCEPSPAAPKWALSHMGLIANNLRLPMLPLSPDGQQRVLAVLEQLEISK